MFKWLTVLYVDPQNLMTNRRKPPRKGPVSVSRQEQCRHEGINTAMTYVVSPWTREKARRSSQHQAPSMKAQATGPPVWSRWERLHATRY